jgi:hypothetical protein
MPQRHHLYIDYTEGEADSYRGVVLKGPDGGETRWMTGDPIADWASYLEHASAAQLLVLESASITHFCFDNTEYRFVENEDGHEVLALEDRPAWLEATSDF